MRITNHGTNPNQAKRPVPRAAVRTGDPDALGRCCDLCVLCVCVLSALRAAAGRAVLDVDLLSSRELCV
jgi:hypothetical protein